MAENFIVIRHAPLARFAGAVLEAAGVPEATASLVAESLVAANLRGVDSHGVQLLLWYIDQIRAGNVDIHQAGHLVSENGVCLVYDGGNGMGQLVSTRCCEHAIRLARNSGIGMVVARNSTHFGACAWWAQKLSAAGMLGIVMCNATSLGGAVAGARQDAGHQSHLHVGPGTEYVPARHGHHDGRAQ
jgi:LDH2 family malate/lactate/ureidoglycolate dehydrogenase